MPDVNLGGVLSAVTDYGDARAAAAADEAATVANEAATETLAALQAKYDAYVVAHPDTPVPDPTPTPDPVPDLPYGGTTGWKAGVPVDLSKEPAGTTYTNGVRSTDQSVNSKAQATFNGGLSVTAFRKVDTSGKVTFPSADVMMRGIKLTIPFAIEADLTLVGTEQSGAGHAFWARGAGEIDFLEIFGAYLANGGNKRPYASKFTLIKVGSNPYNQGMESAPFPRDGASYDGTHRYRWEVTSAGFSAWRDGVLMGTVTPAMFDAKAGKGAYAAQFGDGQVLYPRLTLQVGNGTSSSSWGDPKNFKGGSIRLANFRTFGRA